MMKRLLSIFSVGLAAMAILFLSSVPHHHHGESICFVIEHCTEHNHTEEHDHAAPSDDCDEHHDESGCVLSHGAYLITAENSGIRISASQTEILPLLCEAVDFAFTTVTLPTCSDFVYGRAVVPDYCADTCPACALRAPPITIS